MDLHAMTKSKFIVMDTVDFVNDKTNIIVTVRSDSVFDI